MITFTHIAVHRLLLPVQRLLQHQLCELVPVALRLHVKVKIVIIRYGICAERVCAYVRVKGILHRETGPGDGALRYLHGNVRLGKAGWIVVDIHHLDLHAKELQWVLQKHLQIRCPGKFGNVQPQILCNIPNHRARFLLLWHGVVQLRDRSIQDGEQE
uniref:Uncharacterized protein n=1 Tax=Cyclopterus lumpus TaxID=8103 RepID=A0A8C3AEK0_CYCLU